MCHASFVRVRRLFRMCHASCTCASATCEILEGMRQVATTDCGYWASVVYMSKEAFIPYTSNDSCIAHMTHVLLKRLMYCSHDSCIAHTTHVLLTWLICRYDMTQVCCSAVQCLAVSCVWFHLGMTWLKCVAVRCSVLQCLACASTMGMTSLCLVQRQVATFITRNTTIEILTRQDTAGAHTHDACCAHKHDVSRAQRWRITCA